jgi:hypothetical protein
MFYLDCSCLNLALGIFLEFLGFSDYFSCFKVFSELFLELLLHTKCFGKKEKKRKPILFLTGRARRLEPVRPPRLDLGPAKAHREAWPHGQGAAGR